jgi:hypothetical protein
MKKIILMSFFCLTAISQAEFRIVLPLEISNNGRLPDNSIIFKNPNEEVIPETPDDISTPSNCVGDVKIGTYYLIDEYPDYLITTKIFGRQLISNGTQGKLIENSYETYGVPLYEVCLNGETPKPYIDPVENWVNGDCKYNRITNQESVKYWVEADDPAVQGGRLFRHLAFGNRANGFIGLDGYNADHSTFINFGVKYPYGWQFEANAKVIHNGYIYYKGKFRYKEPEHAIYYHEICRTQ